MKQRIGTLRLYLIIGLILISAGLVLNNSGLFIENKENKSTSDNGTVISSVYEIGVNSPKNTTWFLYLRNNYSEMYFFNTTDKNLTNILFDSLNNDRQIKINYSVFKGYATMDSDVGPVSRYHIVGMVNYAEYI